MLLTDAQIQQIHQIIEDHHTAFIINSVDPSVVSKEVLDDLASKGLVNTDVQSVQDAYLYGQVLAAANNPDVANMSLDEFKAWIRKNPVPLTPMEQQAVTMAQQQAAQYITGLGNRVKIQTGQLLIEADTGLRRRMRDTIRNKVAANIASRETVKQLKSDIGWATKDWTRDLERISVTEKHNAMEQGQADLYAKRFGSDVRVAKIAHPDCCAHCHRIYVGPDGAPRIFRLADLEANGTNVGRRSSEWRPIVGPTHPNCICNLIRVPIGMGFDAQGDMVEGGEFGQMYDPSSLQASMSAERTLLKAMKTRHCIIDFQQIPIHVTHPVGSIRTFPDRQTVMHHAYGYIQGTHGHDGEELDCYIGPNPLTRRAFIIHQLRPDGMFDEDKIMLGFSSEKEARQAYAVHRHDGEACIGSVHDMKMRAFKRWLQVHSHAEPVTKAEPKKPVFVLSTTRRAGDLTGAMPGARGNPRMSGISGAALLFNTPVKPPSKRAQDLVGELPGRDFVESKMPGDVSQTRVLDRKGIAANIVVSDPHYFGRGDIAEFARGPNPSDIDTDGARAAIERRILNRTPPSNDEPPPPKPARPRMLMRIVGLKKAHAGVSADMRDGARARHPVSTSDVQQARARK